MARKRRRKKRRKLQPWMLLGTAVLLLIAAGIAYVSFTEASGGDAQEAPDTIANIAVHTDYIPEGTLARSGRTRSIHYIVIHETDNTGANATAAAHSLYLQRNCRSEQKSWHYTVDDTEIWHHLPDNEVGYHAGDSSWREGGNRNGIGIELCVNAGGNFDQTLQNAAQLTAYLMLTYDLSIDEVKKHQDFSGKICPSTLIRENRWQEFLNMVQAAYTAQTTEIQTETAE